MTEETHEVYEDIETHREEKTTEAPDADKADDLADEDAPEYRDTGDSDLTKD